MKKKKNAMETSFLVESKLQFTEMLPQDSKIHLDDLQRSLIT